MGKQPVVGIKSWPLNERPREKLLTAGEKNLTDSELLAILIQTGTRGASAIDLARAIILKFGSFRNMSHTDARDWQEFKGMGKAKIAMIRAALEISRRFNTVEERKAERKIKITEDIAAMYKGAMRDNKNEIMKAVYLDAKNRIIKTTDIASGTPSSAMPSIREIISQGLQCFAANLICLHNHPSGDPAPGEADREFTDELTKAGKMIDIMLLEHIIFGSETYYSFDKNETKEYA